MFIEKINFLAEIKQIDFFFNKKIIYLKTIGGMTNINHLREFNSEVQHPPNQATCRSSSNTICGCLKSK
ncbi:hypothetical protein, partial [Citrobacter braakii]|uniref:hypothetical protein n=1 Tax=Citrobacter braakii TaxID=57706 RepID=UPI001C3E6194